MKEDEIIQRSLVKALQSEGGIAAAYLFGSFIHGNFTSESDLDLGILFRADAIPDTMALFDLEIRLSDAVRLPVDVVRLNDASPIICMQVLRKGKKIFERDVHSTNEFCILVVNRYDDLKRVRRPIERHILAGRIYS